jgi:hypothetical protein
MVGRPVWPILIDHSTTRCCVIFDFLYHIKKIIKYQNQYSLHTLLAVIKPCKECSQKYIPISESIQCLLYTKYYCHRLAIFSWQLTWKWPNLLDSVICYGIEHVKLKYQSKLPQKMYKKYYTHTLGEYCYINLMKECVDFTTPPISGKSSLIINERKRYYAGLDWQSSIPPQHCRVRRQCLTNQEGKLQTNNLIWSTNNSNWVFYEDLPQISQHHFTLEPIFYRTFSHTNLKATFTSLNKACRFRELKKWFP